MSGILLLAFAIELALKEYLHQLGQTPPYTHDLEELFEMLPSGIQDNIKSVMDSYGGFDELSFNDKLDKSKSVFVEWRYFYASNLTHSVYIRFLEKFYEHITEALNGFREPLYLTLNNTEEE